MSIKENIEKAGQTADTLKDIMMNIEENIEKAGQTADLLLQDLHAINSSGSSLISLMIIPKIEEVAKLQQTLSAIRHAIEPEDDGQSPAFNG